MVKQVFDFPVGKALAGYGLQAGGFQALSAVPVGQVEDPQTGAVSLLGMLARSQDGLHALHSSRADVSGPLQEAFRGPFEMLLVFGCQHRW